MTDNPVRRNVEKHAELRDPLHFLGGNHGGAGIDDKLRQDVGLLMAGYVEIGVRAHRLLQQQGPRDQEEGARARRYGVYIHARFQNIAQYPPVRNFFNDNII